MKHRLLYHIGGEGFHLIEHKDFNDQAETYRNDD